MATEVVKSRGSELNNGVEHSWFQHHGLPFSIALWLFATVLAGAFIYCLSREHTVQAEAEGVTGAMYLVAELVGVLLWWSGLLVVQLSSPGRQLWKKLFRAFIWLSFFGTVIILLSMIIHAWEVTHGPRSALLHQYQLLQVMMLVAMLSLIVWHLLVAIQTNEEV